MKHNPYKIVQMFEEEIAHYTGAKYAVSVDSCTNALFLCLHYLKAKKVILPSRTYISVPFLANKLGITFDWKILEKYPYQKPFFLSGGIGKTELDAVKIFLKTDSAKNCFAIDINSRFETKPGLKSEIKLKKFKKLLYENKI
mgnify:CR=1 FL=1